MQYFQIAVENEEQKSNSTFETFYLQAKKLLQFSLAHNFVVFIFSFSLFLFIFFLQNIYQNNRNEKKNYIKSSWIMINGVNDGCFEFFLTHSAES